MREPESPVIVHPELGVAGRIQAETDIAAVMTRQFVIEVADANLGIVEHPLLGLDVVGVGFVAVQVVLAQVQQRRHARPQRSRRFELIAGQLEDIDLGLLPQ